MPEAAAPVAPVVPAAPAPVAPVAATPATPAATPTPMLGGQSASVPATATPPGQPAAPAAPPAAPAEITFAKVDGFPESEQKLIAAHAKEMGWDQATAQKFHDLQAKHFAAEVQAIEREQAQARNDYIATIKSDPEFGGANFDATLVAANKALALADPSGELTKHLQASGLDAFPAAVKAFARIGAMLQDGKIVMGTPPAPAPKTDADIFYGNTPKT